jgi:hypothetical protein
MDHSPSASIGRPDIVQKVTRRLIPFVGICYLIAYIDRQNVSFAKLQMVGRSASTRFSARRRDPGVAGFLTKDNLLSQPSPVDARWLPLAPENPHP